MELVVACTTTTVIEAALPDRLCGRAGCWTEVPQDWKILHRNANVGSVDVDSLWRHAKCSSIPRYGGVGMFAFPYFVFFEMFGPAVESLGMP